MWRRNCWLTSADSWGCGSGCRSSRWQNLLNCCWTSSTMSAASTVRTRAAASSRRARTVSVGTDPLPVHRPNERRHRRRRRALVTWSVGVERATARQPSGVSLCLWRHADVDVLPVATARAPQSHVAPDWWRHWAMSATCMTAFCRDLPRNVMSFPVQFRSTVPYTSRSLDNEKYFHSSKIMIQRFLVRCIFDSR